MTSEEKYKQDGVRKVMIAGHGGQGILDLGNFIAYQGLKDGDHVVYTPTYGPESRGGKVRCWVTTSLEEIDSPIAEELDVLLIFNKPSMDFVPLLRPGGLLLYNVSIIDRKVGRSDIDVVEFPCTEIAAGLTPVHGVDPAKTLNCVMYGGWLQKLGWDMDRTVSETCDTFEHLYEGFKARFIPMNMAAVKEGFAYMRKKEFQ